ncbi:hypothetical protein ILUMI_27538 [Ignelater luminosus]|uniref:THAP-type domain-containing protein n=1 Tax=Ignelater luminosus TaxID=2038154 RepID=A0A8K0C347_IGNLU|nr:hypothetical protein ILUMI_27538 [Ignelater luminosus]
MWIKAIRRENWKPSKFSVICSEHFLLTDYQLYANPTRPKEGAVASVFPTYPSHLHKKVQVCKLPAQRFIPARDCDKGGVVEITGENVEKSTDIEAGNQIAMQMF